MHIFKSRNFFKRLNKKCFDSAQVGLPLKLKSSVITSNHLDIWKNLKQKRILSFVRKSNDFNSLMDSQTYQTM